MDMTKRAVKAALGFEKDVELARFLVISKQAVSQIGEDEELPEGRQWQIKALRPDLFGAAAGDRSSRHPKAAKGGVAAKTTKPSDSLKAAA